MKGKARLALVAIALLATAALIDTDSYPLRFATRHHSGIALLPPIAIGRFEPLARPLDEALGAATHMAMFRPDAFGHPWPNREKGELVVAVASRDGQAIVEEWIAKGVRLGEGRTGVVAALKTIDLPPPQVNVQTRSVRRSVLGMQQLMDEIIDFTRSGVPGAERIWSLGPDPEHERVVITSDRVNDTLLVALAARFGTEEIAFRVDPQSGPARLLRAAP